MSKIFLFFILTYLLGNPILAIIILLALIYFVDRRYVGLFPSLVKPFQRSRQIGRLRQSIRINPHDTSAKHELARLYMERKKYNDALELMREVQPILRESSDVLAAMGICMLKLQQLEQGEQLILQAVERNPRVMYGEPYLQLGEALARHQPDRAIHYIEQFRTIHSSSCLGFYRLGQAYEQIGRGQDAAQAYRETIELYRALPKYKRKQERKWYVLALLKSMTKAKA